MNSGKTQKDIFKQTEADQWYLRNRDALLKKLDNAQADEIITAISELDMKPEKVLEIGCSNGWRLEKIRQDFGSTCFGIEPSEKAVEDARENFPAIQVIAGSAESLPYDRESFDLVIMGFCLYLCDREDLFAIAASVDAVLADHGLVMILDFLPPAPYKNRYTHTEGVYSYKMDYGKMFEWNPAYNLVYRKIFSHEAIESGIVPPDSRVGVTVLAKDMENAYPTELY